MQKNNRRRSDEGVALILALIFLMAMAILLAGIVDRVRNQSNQVAAWTDFEQTLEGLEAGIAVARAEVSAMLNDPNFNPNTTPTEDKDGLVGVDPGTFSTTSPLPDFGDAGVSPVNVGTMPSVEYFAVSFLWANDGIDNNGNGLTDFPADPGELNFVSIYSFARAPSAIRRVEALFNGGNVNIWQNAIFAGSGQTGNLINGNVAIHGSVHLLGDNLDPNDTAVSALDLSGTSLIHNNYEGITADLRSRVPPLPTTDFEGETGVETLNATLRVKRGKVGMSGNSEIGEAQVAGNAFKETMDGIFNTDGWVISPGGDNGDGTPVNAHSDNGLLEGYDLGGAVPFPTFDDDGGRDHLDFYTELDSDPNAGLQNILGEDINITAGGDNFYWNATNGVLEKNETPDGAADSSGGMPLKQDLNPNEFYIWFDASSNTLVINGRIPVDGDITLMSGNGAPNRLIDYEGRGTLLAFDAAGLDPGNVTLDVSLMTDPFPGNNLIGLMAEGDLSLGNTAQIEIMGAFYAQNAISVDKQTTIMGTIVGDLFNMGTNVPKIYQVPAVADSLVDDNMRMIGSNPVIVLAPLSWRELGVR